MKPYAEDSLVPPWQTSIGLTPKQLHRGLPPGARHKN